MDSNSNIIVTGGEYQNFRDDILSRIRSAQYEAMRAVNKEMIALYWEIGKQITERQKQLGWGKSVVENLSKTSRKSSPVFKGSESQICVIWHVFILSINQMKFSNHWLVKSVGQNIYLFSPSARTHKSVAFTFLPPSVLAGPKMC